MKQNETISSIRNSLEKNLKENLIYNKILTPIETMDKQGYKIFKCEDNIPNLEQWSYGVLNINDGVYYKINLNTTLNYFSNTTFEELTYNETKLLEEEIETLDLKLINKHNNNMGKGCFPELKFKGVEKQ